MPKKSTYCNTPHKMEHAGIAHGTTVGLSVPFYQPHYVTNEHPLLRLTRAAMLLIRDGRPITVTHTLSSLLDPNETINNEIACHPGLCSNFTTMQRGMDRSCLLYLVYYRGRFLSFVLSHFFFRVFILTILFLGTFGFDAPGSRLVATASEDRDSTQGFIMVVRGLGAGREVSGYRRRLRVGRLWPNISSKLFLYWIINDVPHDMCILSLHA